MTNLEIITKQNLMLGKLTMEIQKLKAERESWKVFHKERAAYYLDGKGELPDRGEGN